MTLVFLLDVVGCFMPIPVAELLAAAALNAVLVGIVFESLSADSLPDTRAVPHVSDFSCTIDRVVGVVGCTEVFGECCVLICRLCTVVTSDKLNVETRIIDVISPDGDVLDTDVSLFLGFE